MFLWFSGIVSNFLILNLWDGVSWDFLGVNVSSHLDFDLDFYFSSLIWFLNSRRVRIFFLDFPFFINDLSISLESNVSMRSLKILTILLNKYDMMNFIYRLLLLSLNSCFFVNLSMLIFLNVNTNYFDWVFSVYVQKNRVRVFHVLSFFRVLVCFSFGWLSIPPMTFLFYLDFLRIEDTSFSWGHCSSDFFMFC